MFYMLSKNENGQWEESLYRGKSKQYKDEIDKLEVAKVIDFEVRGKTYAEKQDNLRGLAIDFQIAHDLPVESDGLSTVLSMISLSWKEWYDLRNFFRTNGRRYGLLREFKENCIC